MIGVILDSLFMIPVSFIGGFWINQICYFVLFLLFLFYFGGGIYSWEFLILET